MSTAVLDTPGAKTPPPKSTSWTWLYDAVDRLEPGQSLMVTGANWNVYQNVMQRRDGNRPGMRIHYDHGEILIMATHSWHELWKTILAALIECYAEEMRIPMSGLGGMTISQEDKDRGFEPDECYYIQNISRIIPAPNRNLDFSIDPPPDLTIEIEHTLSVANRLPVFASFRVPEIWRFNGKDLTILHLKANGLYEIVNDSAALPNLPLAELLRSLAKSGSVDQMSIVREFRETIRKNPLYQS